MHEWKIRTQPRYARQQVFSRDRGVCAKCGVNTNQLRLDLLRLKRTDKSLWEAMRDALRQKGIPTDRRWLYDVDHIVPVQEGGGSCGLDNLQTLCIPCHKEKTSQQLKRKKKTAEKTSSPKLVGSQTLDSTPDDNPKSKIKSRKSRKRKSSRKKSKKAARITST